MDLLILNHSQVTSQLAACEKLRASVTGISAIHQTVQEEGRFRTLSPRNSFLDLYQVNAEAILRKKKEEPKTARPNSSTRNPDPVETSNSFSNLEQDVEQPITILNKKPLKNSPILTYKSSKEFIKLFANDFEEHRSLTHALSENTDNEYYAIEPKFNKPIKVVIKGLPTYITTKEIRSDLEELAYVVESCGQRISKINKAPSLSSK
ncbi:hypothetical protein TNCV_3603141 [Trichonephila clavipes]|nr:hypothetical protein TNCV_3603141 [Trichonephila clavipes]